MQGATDSDRPFTHADDAVPAPGVAVRTARVSEPCWWPPGPARPAPVVGDLDNELTGLVAQDDGHRRRPGVAQGIGQGFLQGFISLASGPETDLKVMPTGLGAGILLDALVVRSLLVPALVGVLGRWNWWLPTWSAKALRVAPSPLPSEAELPAPAVVPEPVMV